MTTAIPITATATFCATLVDEWVLAGVTDAFLAPGSRSTPLALALVANQSITVHLFHDERSASFACLGHGVATGRAAILLCTSGTAATHFHAAVVEADASEIPMLVCTADRPPELWGVGAPQTINQTELYGGAVRAFVEPGPPDDEGVDPSRWRGIARASWSDAVGSSKTAPGPVHLNLSFRDPLVGRPGPLPAGTLARPLTLGTFPTTASSPTDESNALATAVAGRAGVIVAGRSSAAPNDVFALADRLGWPVLADHRSGCRRPDQAIAHFDSLLRSSEFADAHRPDVILRIGEPLASKSLSQWITRSASEGTTVIALTDRGRTIDPERVASSTYPIERVLPHTIGHVLDTGAPPKKRTTDLVTKSWRSADRMANAAIAAAITASQKLTEPGIARSVVASVPAGGALVVSSSMPVRDVEWFGANRDDIAVYANRGANGIDGVTSTAIGIALTGTPTTLLIGDVALLHDGNALIGLRDRKIDLTVVVIDNDGGGIFSFLPQHEQLAAADYELLFGTPHGTDLAILARAHRLPVSEWSGKIQPAAGVRIILARTDRTANLAFHGQLADAVALACTDSADTRSPPR